jgi:hypothetical protein
VRRGQVGGVPPQRVREGGLEPPRPLGHRILSPARLPVPALSRCKRAGQSICGLGNRHRDEVRCLLPCVWAGIFLDSSRVTTACHALASAWRWSTLQACARPVTLLANRHHRPLNDVSVPLPPTSCLGLAGLRRTMNSEAVLPAAFDNADVISRASTYPPTTSL